MTTPSRNFVITGTSGTGKTTLIEHLRGLGYVIFDEPTRVILNEQMAVNGAGVPSKNPQLFLDLMLQYCVRCIDQARMPRPGNIFFDRGIPDIVAYAIRFGVSPAPFITAARLHTYNSRVFVLPPWREIFVTDNLRGKTFEEYSAFHDHIVHAYQEQGYQLIDVPLMSVEDRVSFVLNEVKT